MQLSALERELGMQLTERQGRRVALTAAGRALAAHGHDILDRITLAELELDALRSGTVGRYTVSAFPSVARTFLADACRQLIADGDATLDLRIRTDEPDEALAGLSTGTVDLAVIHSYSNLPRELPRGIATHTIGREPVWLAVRRPRHPETAAPLNRLQDYAEQPWIVPAAGYACYDMVERACGLAGFRPRVVAESLDFGVQLELVAAGMGVALVPDLTVDHVPEGVELLRPATAIERTIALAARAPSFAEPGIRRLASVIESAAADVLAERSRLAQRSGVHV
ncbi:LysR substrate-binding domain-containing protein [Microterricola viridarii]|uniref:LysR substrate-binding domain-containing protein n=1 Tax=Microterricola viridarii TaxID=412690 RepID=UPI000AF11D71|nr:LysR substrate-binding domain-containing protein [Microterricola viridarii]